MNSVAKCCCKMVPHMALALAEQGGTEELLLEMSRVHVLAFARNRIWEKDTCRSKQIAAKPHFKNPHEKKPAQAHTQDSLFLVDGDIPCYSNAAPGRIKRTVEEDDGRYYFISCSPRKQTDETRQERKRTLSC